MADAAVGCKRLAWADPSAAEGSASGSADKRRRAGTDDNLAGDGHTALLRRKSRARELIDAAFALDPSEFAAELGQDCDLRLLLSLSQRFGDLQTAAEAQYHKALSDFRSIPAHTAEIGDAVFATGNGDIAGRCLAFLNAEPLVALMQTSYQWRLWAEADAVWLPLAQQRWSGMEALLAFVDASPWRRRQGKVASLYARRCRLERSKMLDVRSREVPRDESSPAELEAARQGLQARLDDYALLVEFHFRKRPPLRSLQKDYVAVVGLVVAASFSGVVAPVRGNVRFDAERLREGPEVSLTLTRRSDGKMMRICQSATLASWVSDELIDHLPLEMGGDYRDGLAHPALWSCLREAACHHVALECSPALNAQTSTQEEGVNSVDRIYIGLDNPLDLLDSQGASRLLRIWEEVPEWV